MDPSSLIFVAIIGIWAAYLLQHWVRRRDQLATARSIDRFSGAMRVLERRAPVPAVPAQPASRTYVVAQVTAHVPTRSSVSAEHAPARTSTPAQVGTHSPKTAASTPQAGASVSPASVRATNARAIRRRAQTLLALLVATMLGWALVPLTPVRWWAGPLVTAVLVGYVAHLRSTARQRRQRREAVQRGASTRAKRSSVRAVAGQVAAWQRERLAQATGRSATSSDSAAPAESGAEATSGDRADELADSTEDAGAAGQSDDRSWQPVPVPPPTYTLKPKAPVVRAQPAQASPPTSAESTTETFDLDEILERRIASGG